MTEDREDAKSILNNQETHINRGFELLLRNRRRKPDPPKTFQIKFGKMVALFRREIVFHLNFFLSKYHLAQLTTVFVVIMATSHTSHHSINFFIHPNAQKLLVVLLHYIKFCYRGLKIALCHCSCVYQRFNFKLKRRHRRH